MNSKCSYHVHKYDIRGSRGLRVSYCTISVYQNGIFNMGIKSHDKFPEKIKILHSVVLKNS